MQYYLSYSLPVIAQALTLWGLLLCAFLPAIYYLKRSQGLAIRLKLMAIAALLLFYLAGLIAYTFLPLPDRQTFTCPEGWGSNYPRFYLGWSIHRALLEEGGFLGVLTSTYILQMLLNVLLFVPYGFLARWILRLGFKPLLFAAFLSSLLIELTQISGLWGDYPCAIRTFDAEDIFNNTLGALLGWALLASWQKRAELKGWLGRLLGP